MYAAAVSFDTHKYIKEFVKAGMPELQAEAVVKLVSDSKDYDLSKLATREQIALFKQETKNDIEKLDQKIESSIEKLDQKIESSIEKLDQKIESSIEKLEQKIEYFRNESKADINTLDQKIDNLEEVMNAKFSAIEYMIENSRKSTIIWMGGIVGAGLASIVAILLTGLIKYMPAISKIVEMLPKE